jgi:hypothetical protein
MTIIAKPPSIARVDLEIKRLALPQSRCKAAIDEFRMLRPGI